MLPRFKTLLAAALFGGTALTLPARAGSFTDAQTSEIGEVVKAYIIAHPEIIQQALETLDARNKEAASKAQSSAIAELHDVIYDSPNQAVIGNPQGKIELVEFVDYNCGYCKRALADTRAMIDQDKDVKIVLKEFPILSPGSVEAARVASAVNKVAPDKYAAFHFELMGGRGQADEAKALDAAGKVGVDVTAVKTAMADPKITDGIQESYKIARKLDISGTPTYIVGDELVAGAIGIDDLRQKFASMRACGKTTC